MKGTDTVTLAAPNDRWTRGAGIAAIIGGVFGILLAPIMVMVKYMTGWSVVPEPAWIGVVGPALQPILSFATPVGLWVLYGSMYTAALLLMCVGFLGLMARMKDERGRVKSKGLWVGLWILLVGLCMVLPGDAVHTATWHQNGLMVPTPGTNRVANTAYAIHMMGMNFVLVGSLVAGISALRRRALAPWLGWLFVAIAPSAVILGLTLLPTSPSGGLWMFSIMMTAVGYSLATGKPMHCPAA